jgi:hypothetical protein
MGEFVTPVTLRELERATRRSLEDHLGAAASQCTVKAERQDNVTAAISLRGPYDLLKPLLDKLGYATEHSISFSFTTDAEGPEKSEESEKPEAA